ncbi:DsrE/DsrF/DrsH-like family protein [Varunaivibrio sulfuroxidans]|uniref:Peroxiredoxin family protein n=1 Tax=Varunaivibrio sulfuroxidans TaxID=1773489 RepID=A0A4V6NYL0_9PROT|nr:DsrE/DsrF/DrsH-like family protein [Varunaivibrio sulfuroxidans]TCS65111.1 peroxiredoxin family protein [Varunaivibrio sulfuroxidans]WES29602.1 DsrE/DsrF/DrsH-like family protein [Varunaivibrio sulfuroxidans]
MNTRPDKLSIVVFSGDFDRVHYALVLASGSQAAGIATTLFFTMEGARALCRNDEQNPPAWRALPLTTSQFTNGGAMDDAFKARGVGDFETLLRACIDMGVVFMVCEMGLAALGIPREELRADIPFVDGGVVTFLNDASKNGSILFI